jgi:hypothetical protein
MASRPSRSVVVRGVGEDAIVRKGAGLGPVQERANDAAAGAGTSAAVLFARSARALQDAARASGLTVPAFRSPPRRRDCDRTIRRLRGGAIVAVRIHGRSAAAVQCDMVDGLLVANALRGSAADRLRGRLLSALAAAVPDAKAAAAAEAA